MMRLLNICYEYPPIGGGGAKVAAGLARELVGWGHEIELFTMGFRGLQRHENIEGVSVNRVPCLRLQPSICHPTEMATYLVMALPELLRITRRIHFDLNHTHFIFPDGLLAYYLKKFRHVPYVITAHGSDVPGYNPNRFRSLHRILAPVWRLIVNHAKEIVSPSHHLARLIEKQKPLSPITVIPNGFLIKENPVDLTKRKGLNILVVSRIFERKGIQYLLQALNGINDKYQVDIVGDGPYLPDLKRMVVTQVTQANICFHGWLDNNSERFRNLFEAASIFVFPSISENFPTVLLEAMSAGLAIITTEGTGCEEVVGDTALLVRPRDVEGLRTGLQFLTSHPDVCRQLGQSARERLENKFSWQAVANQYIFVYNRSMISL